jgi:predicted nuclease of predicted toxin-antitoxin system
MKVKLDENLGHQAEELLRKNGHDVQTVASQELWGSEDTPLIQTCRSEGRCLVTLDLEFANPLVFRPSEYEGIAVLRLPRKPSPDDLLDVIKTLAGALTREEIKGKLWTVQSGRVRVYQEPDTD